MSDWRQDIINHHRLDHEDDPGSLQLGEPATPQALRAFEEWLGRALPEEFHDLYGQFDGYGTACGHGTDWFFVPLEHLPEHIAAIRDWFQETHGDLAARFVPFVDWGNGDASGYLFTESGELEPGIYMFEHEAYLFEDGQDPDDFLYPVDEDLRSFLND